MKRRLLDDNSRFITLLQKLYLQEVDRYLIYYRQVLNDVLNIFNILHIYLSSFPSV